MIFEWRTYRFAPGAATAYLAVFREEGLPLVTRHLPLLGYWLTECGRLNVLHHLWVYADLDDRAARRAALAADTDWSAGFGPRAFPMIERQESLLLVLRNGSRRLSDAVATPREPRAAVPGDAPLLAPSWAMLELSDDAPAAPGAAETTGLWQVIAGRRRASHLALFHAAKAGDVTPPDRPALLRELLRPATFSPLR